MKTCKNCGASINDDSRFCTSCGADTFESAAEETAVLTETSAQPETDNTEAAQPEATQTEAPAQSGEYYQPAGGTTEGSTASSYTYAVPTDQTPVGKGKKGKGRVWAIIAAVIVILGIVIRFGLGALGLFGEVADKLSSISEGYETSTAYINNSLNLQIDTTKGGMEVLTDSEKREYFGIDPNDYETFIYDFDTDEYLYIMIAEGSLTESAQNLKSFAKEIAEYVYEGESNYHIGEAYERDIAGNTFTCIDISQTVEDDPYYGTYYLEQTLCFIKSTTVFMEISITTYPEESGNHAQDIIDRYISTIK